MAIRSETIPPVCNAKRAKVQVLPASSAPLQYTLQVTNRALGSHGSKQKKNNISGSDDVQRPRLSAGLRMCISTVADIAVQRPFNSLSLPSLVGDLCSERSSECVPFPSEAQIIANLTS